jgi:D-serine deaminase-like pyridoxal phosphate-dependent protein
MDELYYIADTSRIITPALVIFRELVESNIDGMVRLAGDARRLRPHCKTHKMREVIELQLARGVVKHKCATLAEAEMLADAGAKDIFLAYNLVGPNIARAVRFVERFPDVRFAVTADHREPIAALGKAMSVAGRTIEVLLDIDAGFHRTGVAADGAAIELYRAIADTAGLTPGGLHHYDGHNAQTSLAERTEAVLRAFEPTRRLKEQLESHGLSVPRIVVGGTGSFPIFAQMSDPAIELSPGTCVLHDAGYKTRYPDLPFTPAAVLLTRVISRPAANRVTCDLGYKACASDPPAGTRLSFVKLPEAREVLQNEEHLVLETNRAGDFQPGDELLAIPRHICPTSALHKHAYVVSGGRVTGIWSVAARDRQLTV